MSTDEVREEAIRCAMNLFGKDRANIIVGVLGSDALREIASRTAVKENQDYVEREREFPLWHDMEDGTLVYRTKKKEIGTVSKNDNGYVVTCRYYPSGRVESEELSHCINSVETAARLSGDLG